MNFSKTFLAGLLAFIVGNILIAVLWSLFVMGIVGALSATTGIDDNSILRIDLSENIVEAPPADPFAGVDFRTMTATPHVTLFEALRAIDAAKSDPRIKGIYIRPNGQGTVSMAVLEELRAAILDFKQESGKFVLAYNEAYGGAVWFDRVNLEVRSELAGNDANVWKGYARWSAGFNDWRFACCGGISGGTQLIPTGVGG